MKKLHEMTLPEKIGQLLMVGFLGTEQVPEGMQELVREMNLGGAIYFSRNVQSPEQLADLSQQLQNLAKESSTGLPLFISIDQEGGIVSRMPNGTSTIFPGNMALGATRDPELAYEMGRVVAKELRAVGVNINLAPVLDVNNNPANPVINVRSYGEDPELVGRLGTAYIKGLQVEGVLACGKHFPGHGDSSFDSHFALAVIPHSRERLQEVELRPFKEAMAAGLASVMSAHVIFPAFEPDEGIPGTLSRRVLTDLLRKELGYEGLVLTDCMEMHAISKHFGPAEAAVRAIEAGADQVLVSHTLETQKESYHGLLAAVQSGRLTEERIDESITRILKWKEFLGWDKWSKDDAELANVGSEEHRKLAGTIGERAVTLVKDARGILPVSPEKTEKVVLIYPLVKMLTVVEEKDAWPRENILKAFKAVYSNVEMVTISMDPDALDCEQAKKAIEGADLVVFSAFFAAKNPAQAKLINELAHLDVNMVTVAIRNPYDLSVLSEVPVYLTTYDYNEYNLQGVARVIAGQSTAQGVLPITIPGGAQ